MELLRGEIIRNIGFHIEHTKAQGKPLSCSLDFQFHPDTTKLLVMLTSYSRTLKVTEWYTILGNYCVSRMDDRGWSMTQERSQRSAITELVGEHAII